MQYENQIDDLIKNNKHFEIKNIIKDVKDNNFDKDLIIKLESLLTDKVNISKKEFKFGNLTTDLIFKKEWKKLHEIHKIIKVREFVDLNYHNEIDKIKNEIKQFLIYNIKNKNLCKKDQVLYDYDTCIIESINNFVFDVNTKKSYFKSKKNNNGIKN